jgi:hypothetical protein
MSKNRQIVRKPVVKPYYVMSGDCILYTESEKRDIKVQPRFVV